MPENNTLLHVEDLILHFRTTKGPVQAVDGASFDLGFNEAIVALSEELERRVVFMFDEFDDPFTRLERVGEGHDFALPPQDVGLACMERILGVHDPDRPAGARESGLHLSEDLSRL